ncbi:MAG: ferredoxin [Hyphomicrobiaceae bacterium]
MQGYDELAAAVQAHGLIVRGGFALSLADRRQIGLRDSALMLVLIGNAGDAMWRAFAPHREPGPDPLDAWTEHVVSSVAEEFRAEALYPWSKPYRPFQQWAMRAEAVSPSPLGILMHPEHGLWHAYRAALALDHPIDLPPRPQQPSPCDNCFDKPCLSACPVGAFAEQAYDVGACAAYLSEPPGQATCRSNGCRARAACPVGRPYPSEQIEFHMAAFYASRAPI